MRAMRLAWLALILASCSPTPPPCPCKSPTPAPTTTSASTGCASATTTAAYVPPPLPTTCGGLALREARLVAGGKGDNHPDLLLVRGHLSACKDRTPTPAECAAVMAEGAQLATQYGPNHPLRIMNDAEKALCPSPVTKKPPPPDEEQLPEPYAPPKCGAGKSACGMGPNAACCAGGETCCAGGAAGHYYCRKGKGPCPPLP